MSAVQVLTRCGVLGPTLAALVLASPVSLGQVQDAGDDALERFLSRERVTAWLRVDVYQSSNSLDDEGNLLGGTLQVKALPRLNELVDSKVEARFSAPDVRMRLGYRAESELIEGYVTLHFSHADLRVGKQIVAWGRADGINPTDNLTPRDYLVLLPLEEDQRFGTWAMRLDTYLPQALTLEVFATPFFESDRFALPTDGAPVSIQRPGRSANHSEVGVRLNKVSGQFDWSLSYYHGYSLLPTVGSLDSLLPTIAPAETSIHLYYDHMEVVGADCARNFGRFGFRSELAYVMPADHETVDPNANRPRLFWVNGIDRKFFENLNVNVQLFFRWMPQYETPSDLSDPVARTVSTLNTIINGQQAGVSPGLTFRVSNQWFNDTLRAEMLVFTNFTRGDRYVRPLLTYDVNDRTRVLLGANLYRGPQDAEYGVSRPDSGAFAEFRYGF